VFDNIKEKISNFFGSQSQDLSSFVGRLSKKKVKAIFHEKNTYAFIQLANLCKKIWKKVYIKTTNENIIKLAQIAKIEITNEELDHTIVDMLEFPDLDGEIIEISHSLENTKKNLIFFCNIDDLKNFFDSLGEKKIIGFSRTKSVFDFHFFNSKLFSNKQKKPKKKMTFSISDEEIFAKFQKGNINFADIFFTISKIKGMMSSYGILLSKMGITPEAVKELSKLSYIGDSMTYKELFSQNLNNSQIARISKGCGVHREKIENLVKVLQTMRNSGGQMINNFMKPEFLGNLLNMGKK